MADKPAGTTAVPQAPTAIPALGKVLITGGCGFLGSHIVSILLAKTSLPTTSIHVLDLRAPTTPQVKVTYHTANLTSATSVREIFDSVKPDVVIHTASPVFRGHTKEGPKEKELMWNINVEGTRTLLNESKRVGVKVFVYTSSASVVSDTRMDLINADERWNLIKGNIQKEYYTTTKVEGELLALSYNSRTEPFLTTAIRPSAIFGEMDVQVIPNLLKVARDGRTKFQLGSNDNLFDFTYVGNTAFAHVLAAVKLLELYEKLQTGSTVEKVEEDSSKVDGEAFIITNHSPVYFWDFTRAVWNEYYRISPSSMSSPPAPISKVITLPRGLAVVVAIIATFILGLFGKQPTLTAPRVRYSCMTRYFRTRKAEAALNYVPEFTLDEGIERTVKWFVDREKAEGVAEGGKKDR